MFFFYDLWYWGPIDENFVPGSWRFSLFSSGRFFYVLRKNSTGKLKMSSLSLPTCILPLFQCWALSWNSWVYLYLCFIILPCKLLAIALFNIILRIYKKFINSSICINVSLSFFFVTHPRRQWLKPIAIYFPHSSVDP